MSSWTWPTTSPKPTPYAVRMARRVGRRCGAALLALGVVAAVVVSAPVAQAIDKSKGYPGFCKDGKGVTVVIDFQQLGGETIVRCNPTSTRGTGLDALKGAGIQVAGVQRWGESFICRIENRPSAVESVPIDTDPSYREQCINTPPAKAYWSYWHAGNNCPWHYSQWGVKNRDFAQGGFEGWSFSLNANADSNPKPRIAAVRPGTQGAACSERAETAPTTNDPNERQPGSTSDNGYVPDPTHGQDGQISADPADPDRPENRPAGQPGSTRGSAGAGAPGTGSTSGHALPAPRPRTSVATPRADDTADNVAFTGGEQAPDVREVIKDQAGASDLAPWAAVGAIVLLGSLAFVTARRRQRLREDA